MIFALTTQDSTRFLSVEIGKIFKQSQKERRIHKHLNIRMSLKLPPDLSDIRGIGPNWPDIDG
jgi:hypothetical protein